MIENSASISMTASEMSRCDRQRLQQSSNDFWADLLEHCKRCAVDDHSGKLIVEVERQLHDLLARLRTAGYGEIQSRLTTLRLVSCGSGKRRLCVFGGLHGRNLYQAGRWFHASQSKLRVTSLDFELNFVNAHLHTGYSTATTAPTSTRRASSCRGVRSTACGRAFVAPLQPCS